jgi:hypothetical protein
MNRASQLAAACLLASSAQLAQAVPTAGWTTTDTHVYGQVVNFDSVGVLANDTVISNQFQAEGLSFSGSIRANGCGHNAWTTYAMAKNTLVTFGPGCVTNAVNDAFAIKFDRTVSKLALDAYQIDNSHIASLGLYLNGNLVSNFSMTTLSYDGLATNSYLVKDGRNFVNTGMDRAGILQIDGARFDEIRFVENWDQNHWGYLIFDNLRFDAAASDVPEPASLGLLALGLAGIGAMRRKLGRAAQA